jgi:hypothetical protein
MVTPFTDHGDPLFPRLRTAEPSGVISPNVSLRYLYKSSYANKRTMLVKQPSHDRDMEIENDVDVECATLA